MLVWSALKTHAGAQSDALSSAQICGSLTHHCGSVAIRSVPVAGSMTTIWLFTLATGRRYATLSSILSTVICWLGENAVTLTCRRQRSAPVAGSSPMRKRSVPTDP